MSVMPRTYIIRVQNRTAGIVASRESGFHFFSSERSFDILEDREFDTARDAARAVKALFDEQHHTDNQHRAAVSF
jgi:hypothetical protein